MKFFCRRFVYALWTLQRFLFAVNTSELLERGQELELKTTTTRMSVDQYRRDYVIQILLSKNSFLFILMIDKS